MDQLPLETTSRMQVGEFLQPQLLKKWNMEMILKYDSSLQTLSDKESKRFSSLIFEPSYQINSRTSVSGRLDAIQELTQGQASRFSDAEVVFGFYRFDFLNGVFLPNVSILLPTDSKKRDETSYRGTLSFEPTLMWTASSRLRFGNTVYFSKNFHLYQQDRDFLPNIEYSLRERFMIFFALLKKIRVELINDYVWGWTYQKTLHEEFYFSQVLYYDFLPQWYGLFSHQNGGDHFGLYNDSNNVSFFNKKTSYVSVGVGYVF